jgi:hypothetical protein
MTSSKPRVGAFVFATEQGIGYMAKEFYDNGLLDEVVIHRHSTRENHLEWYPNHKTDIVEFFKSIDILLIFETPFVWKNIPLARDYGVKTVLIPMYECTQFPFPYEPDEIWCPSALDYQHYKEKGKENIKLVQIPVEAKWKLREKAFTFVHNAGNGGLGGRNGTSELLQAMEFVKSPIKLIVRSQAHEYKSKDERITFVNKSVSKEELWEEGDVFVFPEKFNGLSLPLQEAYASGMLVMATNRFPNTEYLPNGPLIRVDHFRQDRYAVKFESACINPKDVASQIDSWYAKDIKDYSLKGKEYNEKNSWKAQKEVYEKLLLQLWEGRAS